MVAAGCPDPRNIPGFLRASSSQFLLRIFCAATPVRIKVKIMQEPDYRTTFKFVLTMLAGIIAGWIGMLFLLWSRR